MILKSNFVSVRTFPNVTSPLFWADWCESELLKATVWPIILVFIQLLQGSQSLPILQDFVLVACRSIKRVLGLLGYFSHAVFNQFSNETLASLSNYLPVLLP